MTRNETLPRTAGLAVALATVGLVAGACGAEDSTGTTTQTPAEAADTSAAAGNTYRDGTYSATGKYVSPGGPQQVGVTVTLSSGVIKNLQLDTGDAKGTSKDFQGKFAGGIDAIVVGKNIDDLEVDKVAGSSLTSGGFNDALAQIKSEAQV
ncbi:FMN-binding protein [Gordonia sp. NPDC003424]